MVLYAENYYKKIHKIRNNKKVLFLLNFLPLYGVAVTCDKVYTIFHTNKDKQSTLKGTVFKYKVR